MDHTRLLKLARRIDAIADKDERLLLRTREMEELRRKGAMELHAICAGFVTELNVSLTKIKLELDPPDYSPDKFNPDGANLFQMNARGRIVQIEFESPEHPVSTENFRVPYVLEGSIRCFNQDLLDRAVIEEQLLFYCLERSRNPWRYFEGRTYKTGLFDAEYLISLMESLV